MEFPGSLHPLHLSSSVNDVVQQFRGCNASLYGGISLIIRQIFTDRSILKYKNILRGAILGVKVFPLEIGQNVLTRQPLEFLTTRDLAGDSGMI